MNAVTLFAGAGGADLGMRRAGVHHLACVEGWPVACETLKAAGFPAVNAWIGENGPPLVRTFDPYIYAGAVDLGWFSPPCQGYSQAGLRLGSADPRDGWRATLRSIHAMRPAWVIVENVGGAPIEEWAADLGGLFARYRYPCVSYRTLDAADWGLPSHRVRQFLVAGPKPYRWPEPTHCGPDAPVGARVRLLPWVGFGAALGLVPGSTLLPGNGGHLPAPRCASEPAHAVTASCPQYLLSLPSSTVCATEEKGHTNPHIERGRATPVNRASDSLFLATGRRRLTWQECAVLLGFPADYPFAGGIGAKYKQIGNAVAPVVAEALARQVQVSE